MKFSRTSHAPCCRKGTLTWSDDVITSPRLLNLPLLLLANKQDKATSLTVAEIRESFEAWERARPGKDGDDAAGAEPSPEARASDVLDAGAKRERIASLDVLGVSALEG